MRQPTFTSLLCGLVLTACLGVGRVEAVDYARLDLITDALDYPVNVEFMPGARDHVLVAERARGTIALIVEGKRRARPFLDLSREIEKAENHEQGLLSLAFPPAFHVSPRIFVTYTDRSRNLRLDRFDVDPDAVIADKASGKTILIVERFWVGHHGGHIEFGPSDG